MGDIHKRLLTFSLFENLSLVGDRTLPKILLELAKMTSFTDEGDFSLGSLMSDTSGGSFSLKLLRRLSRSVSGSEESPLRLHQQRNKQCYYYLLPLAGAWMDHVNPQGSIVT